MKKDIVSRWIEALKSGEYKQGQKELVSFPSSVGNEVSKENNSFCCLGVLCDILKPDLEGEWILDEDEQDFRYACKIDSIGNTEIPNKLKDKSRLRFVNFARLIELNDKGESFSTIADEILYQANNPHIKGLKYGKKENYWVGVKI